MARTSDTAISGRGASEGKAYFFSDDQYLRYDWNAGQVDEGYPQPIDFDQVIDGNLPMFIALLEPDPNQARIFGQADSPTHQNPSTFEELCQVQALHLDDPGRVLYSIQFHPELLANDASVDQQSEQLLLNFIHTATAFWAQNGNL